jgi:hypothetical protein
MGTLASTHDNHVSEGCPGGLPQPELISEEHVPSPKSPTSPLLRCYEDPARAQSSFVRPALKPLVEMQPPKPEVEAKQAGRLAHLYVPCEGGDGKAR